MGQKVNPIGFRLKIINGWSSLWYADKDYHSKLYEDLLVRRYIDKSLGYAAVGKVVIDRKVGFMIITVHSAKPGLVIGKKGFDIEKIKQKISEMIKSNIEFNIIEIKKPEANAALIARGIAQQLERRSPFRRVMKRAVQSCLRVGGKGIKVRCSGRLGGAEIARAEFYKEGKLPLHTLRADIDYAFSEARTIYGIIGVKAWVCISD